MAVPKKKTSKSRRNMRRAHDALKPIHLATDKETGEYKLPHHTSLVDGYYKGRQVINVKGLNTKDTDNSETESNC